MKHILLLALALVASSSLASAQSHVDAGPTTSITFSPIHLLMPVFEVEAEFKVAPKSGMAGIAGIGSMSVINWQGASNTFSVFELGASYRYYLVGDFDHGMQVGGEILYANVSGDIGDASGIGRGLAMGPFLGYKYAAGFGLTVEVQGGAQFMLATGNAEDTSTGQTSSAADSGIIALVNLNLGWSF
jgi:opacity protein-like surface antigen